MKNTLIIILSSLLLCGCLRSSSGPRTTPATESVKGQLIGLAQLVDAGNATPEAAWVSRYWARAHGDYDAVIAATDPQKVDAAKAWMGDKATFRARSQTEFASFKGIQILARKNLASDRVELKYQFAFGKGPTRQETKIVEMVKIEGAWKSGQTRVYDASWDDGSQPEPQQAAPATVVGTGALMNWQMALSIFKKSGAFIGQDKGEEAKAELSAGATNLPAPYSNMASQFLARLESTLKQSPGKSDPRQRKTLSQLCGELHAYEAALRLSVPAGGGSSTVEARDEREFAWRLFESGDVPAALNEYRRKLAEEQVDTWQDYYKEQIRLIEQRPANLTNVQFAIKFVQEHYLKGFEEKADVFGALQELTRVLPFARSPREGASVCQFLIKCLERLDDTAGREAWEDKLLSDLKADSEACAQVYLERGLRAMEKEAFVPALSSFHKVCTEYADTEAYGDAQFSVGVVLQQQQKYDDAVAEFDKLFPSKVNDYAVNPESSDDRKNYRFRAALRISGCYEAKKDFARALEYTELARDRYKFISYCKSCMEKTKESVEKRITQLKEALSKSTP